VAFCIEDVLDVARMPMVALDADARAFDCGLSRACVVSMTASSLALTALTELAYRLSLVSVCALQHPSPTSLFSAMQADRRGYVSSPRRWRIAAGGGGLVALCHVGGCSGWAVMAAERCERFVRLVDAAARRDARVTSSPELAVPASTDSNLHAKGKFFT